MGLSITKFIRRLIAPPGQKASPFFWPVWVDGGVQWQAGNFRNYANEGFNINSLIYSAIMYKVRAAAQVKMRAYIGDPMNPEPAPPNHPLARLVSRPNPHQSWRELHALIVVYLNLSGNAYLYLDREKSKMGLPGAIYPMRPDRVFIIPKDGTIVGYQYRPDGASANEGVPMLPEDVIHLKFPNPMDPFEGMGYGLSPMSSIARNGDIDNQVTKFLKVFFEKGGMPPGVLQFEIPIQDQVVATIKRRWRETYGGVDNWTDIGVLDSGAKFQKIGFDFNEMGFDSIDERSESRILGAFGVPPILIGTRFGMERSTDTNYVNARRSFWEDTMMYELSLQQDEYDHYLVSDDGAFARYDYSSVPALQKNIPELVESAEKLFAMGVPSDIAFQTVGLQVEKTQLGGTVFIPSTFIPYGEDGKPILPEQANDDPPDLDLQRDQPDDNQDRDQNAEDSAKSETETRALVTKKRIKLVSHVDEIAEAHENGFLEAASTAFEEDLRAVLAIIERTKQKSLKNGSSINWTSLSPEIRDYLQTSGATNWCEQFIPLIEGVVSDTAGDWSTQLGVQFNVRHLLAEDWFGQYTLNFAQPIVSTTETAIHEILGQAMEEGWTIAETQTHLTKIFRQWQTGSISPEEFEWLSDRTPPYRAEMIARTETIRAANAGSHALYSRWGVQEREWLAANDDRTRDSHRAANGQKRKIDEPFVVGGYRMMYPGDATLGAPAREFVNCRCTTLPVISIDDRNRIQEQEMAN